ncbi:hypothetical protein ACFOWT_18280 [Croceibacterium xixiisoli]|uniref:hypothetical protein n=1 Tax=Croceibacterium xixiisoli TaxID=1476466 RepID=UPI00137004D2|nr:hypothetical protein [Croceibacterium xixiisoli]
MISIIADNRRISAEQRASCHCPGSAARIPLHFPDMIQIIGFVGWRDPVLRPTECVFLTIAPDFAARALRNHA